MKRLIVLILIFFIKKVTAQQKVFSEEEFTSVVKKFHPVVKLAVNNVKMAKWNITSSRSGFDPEWKSQHAQKDFDGLTYYNQISHEIKVPTWYGIDVYAGQETIDGSKLNPEKTTGAINYLGVSVPLVQNMVMDKRRAALLLAKNYFKLSDVERELAVNDLISESLEAYWTWWQHYYVYNLMNRALANAKRRFDFIKVAYQLGDRPAVDTLEALTQVQSFEQKVSEAFANYTKSQLSLSAFLWTANAEQVEISTDVIPEMASSPKAISFDELMNASTNHPELRQYEYKLNGLQIEKKLKFQLLLPEVKIKYNQLGRDLDKTIAGAWFSNNYNYGISFSMPLRLSEGRGEYAGAKIKIENTLIERNNKQVQLQIKLKQYFTEWQQTVNQLSVQNSLLNSYSGLQRAEEMRFSNGESNLFLINAREIKTIEAEQKLIELQAKNKQAYVKLQWSAGVLGR